MELSSIKKPIELGDVFVVRTQIEGIYDRLIAYFFIRDKTSTALSDSFIEGFNCSDVEQHIVEQHNNGKSLQPKQLLQFKTHIGPAKFDEYVKSYIVSLTEKKVVCS